MYKIRLWVDAMCEMPNGEPERHIDIYRSFDLPFVPSIGLTFSFGENVKAALPDELLKEVYDMKQPIISDYTVDSVTYNVDPPTSLKYDVLARSSLYCYDEKSLIVLIKTLVLSYGFELQYGDTFDDL